jgi:flavodoxin
VRDAGLLRSPPRSGELEGERKEAAMKTLVVYESMYGNTRAIAEAIATGIGPVGEVEITEVSAAPQTPPADVELVVVGGPTHAHGMSRPQSREAAAKDGPIASRGIGVREWIEGTAFPEGVRVAAFDTRIGKAQWITGSAARSMTKLLRRHGFTGDVPTESFLVDHTLGPLRDGELRRAREWGAQLAARRTVAV